MNNYFNYHMGTTRFMLDNVQCSGIEQNIDQCPHDPWWQHDCKENEVAGVSCIDGESWFEITKSYNLVLIKSNYIQSRSLFILIRKYVCVCLSVCVFVRGHLKSDWDTLWHKVSLDPE